MRRRLQDSPGRRQRVVADFAMQDNGDGPLHDGGSKSILRRSTNTLRLRLHQVMRESGGHKGVIGLAYLSTCALLLWVGTHIPHLVGSLAAPSVAYWTGTSGGSALAIEQSTTKGAFLQDEDKSLTAALDGPTLAYGIMVYQRKGHEVNRTLSQFTRMFDALYDEHNMYVIHVDVKSDPELIERITAHIDPLSNAHQVSPVSVSWGGVTVVERTLALMQKALEVDKSWRFFVNLGHEDYPSVSQAEVRRWLKDKEDGTNYIKCWAIEGHDFFGQWERHESRVQDVHVDDFMGGVKEYRTVKGKPGSQDRPKSGYRFFKSLQQTMLSRDLSEYAVTDVEARRLLLYMATSKAPDELYFPTLTQLDDRFASKATCNDTRHFSYWVRPGGSWHPEYLTLDHLPLVLNASEFYIRKVDVENDSGPLLDVLDSLQAGNSLNQSLPILTEWLNRPEAIGGGPLEERFEGGTGAALRELYRRQSEDVEARRCTFISRIYSKRDRFQANSRMRKIGPLTKEQAEAAAEEGAGQRASKLPWKKKGDVDKEELASRRSGNRKRSGKKFGSKSETKISRSLEAAADVEDVGEGDRATPRPSAPNMRGVRPRQHEQVPGAVHADKSVLKKDGGFVPVGVEPMGRRARDDVVS